MFGTDGVALVLGGDCSILVGTGVALARRGRHGQVHIDGHTDFRHPGNSPVCVSLAGEDLAAAVGKHWPAVADIDGLAPYFRPGDALHVGCRDDECLDETAATLGAVVAARQVRENSVAVQVESAQLLRRQRCDRPEQRCHRTRGLPPPGHQGPEEQDRA